MRTRLSARAELCERASVGGAVVLRARVRVEDAELAAMRRVAQTEGARIFNPDSKRLQAALEHSDPVVARVLEALGEERLLRGREVGPAVVLHSRPGCEQQQWHTDYDGDRVRRSPVKPLGVLVALERDGTRLELRRTGTLHLSRGDVVVFDGDEVHAGSAYPEANTRLHLYLDTPAHVYRDENSTYLCDVDRAASPADERE